MWDLTLIRSMTLHQLPNKAMYIHNELTQVNSLHTMLLQYYYAIGYGFNLLHTEMSPGLYLNNISVKKIAMYE